MKSHSGDLAWGIKVGLLGVLAFMTWPIWGEIVAGFHHFSWAVAASALVPLTITLAVPFLIFDGPDRVGSAVRKFEHVTHIDNLLHHGQTHRHA
jgi:hypothetical protein